MSPVYSLNNMTSSGLMKVFFLVCGCALLSAVEGQKSSISCQPFHKSCGDTCCQTSDYCEKDDDGKGTCHAAGTRVDCDFMYYCYSPTICCGFGSCCPANSTCCGLNHCCAKDAMCCSGSLGHCCPADSICCGLSTCCPQGSVCKNGYRCVATSSSFFASRWYFTVLVLIPMIIFMLFLRQKMLQRRRNAQYASRSEQINPVMATNNGYNGYNEPIPQYNYTAQPPSYSEVGQGPPADFMMSPPPYEEVVKSTEGNTMPDSEHIDQPAPPQQLLEVSGEPTSQQTATLTPPNQ